MKSGSATKTLFCMLAFGLDLGSAHAADYGAPPPRIIEGIGPELVETGVAGFDQRCRIIPSPQMNLVGDVGSFRPIAVCQSRGLYADSVSFPDSLFFFGLGR